WGRVQLGLSFDANVASDFGTWARREIDAVNVRVSDLERLAGEVLLSLVPHLRHDEVGAGRNVKNLEGTLGPVNVGLALEEADLTSRQHHVHAGFLPAHESTRDLPADAHGGNRQESKVDGDLIAGPDLDRRGATWIVRTRVVDRNVGPGGLVSAVRP